MIGKNKQLTPLEESINRNSGVRGGWDAIIHYTTNMADDRVKEEPPSRASTRRKRFYGQLLRMLPIMFPLPLAGSKLEEPGRSRLAR